MKQSTAERILAILATSPCPLSAAQLAKRLGQNDDSNIHCAVKRMIDRRQGFLFSHKQTCEATGLYRKHYWSKDWKPSRPAGPPAQTRSVLARSQHRAMMAAADTCRGETKEVTSWGQVRYTKRNRFPDDRESLQGRYDEITLAQKQRLERWAMRA